MDRGEGLTMNPITVIGFGVLFYLLLRPQEKKTPPTPGPTPGGVAVQDTPLNQQPTDSWIDDAVVVVFAADHMIKPGDAPSQEVFAHISDVAAAFKVPAKWVLAVYNQIPANVDRAEKLGLTTVITSNIRPAMYEIGGPPNESREWPTYVNAVLKLAVALSGLGG